MIARADFKCETGVASSWRNDSNVLRELGRQRKSEKKHIKAAQRRITQPNRPFDPSNPYDSPLRLAEDEDDVSVTSSITSLNLPSIRYVYA